MKNYLYDLIIHNVLAANRIYLKKGTNSKKSNRETTGILIQTQGATTFKQKGNEFISDRNHILVFPKGCDYEYLCSEDSTCYIIELNTPFLEENNILSVSITNFAEFISIFNRIEHSLNFKEEGKNAFLLQDAYRLLTKLIDQTTEDYLLNQNSLLLMPALTYIEENLSSPPPTNEFLASLCSISCVYFRKLFVKKYGMPPLKYVTNLKIQKAKGLIISDFLSFGEIAQNCGFTSIYHFSKVFKNETGLTPTEYKKSIK